MSIQKQVNEILLEILEISEGDIKANASIANDLGASSVDLVEVIAALENEFDLDIPEDDIEDIRTVQAIYDYIGSKTDG